jgi:gas vesicle protein
MKSEESNLGKKLPYLLIGGGIGAILALLFAPQAGEKFRADIADATRKGIDRTGETANQVSKKANTVYAEITTKAGEIYDSAKQKLSVGVNVVGASPGNLQNAVHDKAEQISATIEAGQKE